MTNNNKTTWNQDYYTDKKLKYLSNCIDGTFSIDLDGFVNVDGNVQLSVKDLTTIPYKFGKVTGSFYCFKNKLTSLKGCPYYVGGFFDCHDNLLKSFEYAPKYVGSKFICYNNKRKFSNIEIRKYTTVIGKIFN